MRCLAIAAVSVVLCWPLSAQAQPGTVKGIITGLTKAENTPTGSITITTATGTKHKFLVTEFTTWETVQASGIKTKPPTIKASSFLAGHRGQRAEVYVQAGVAPPTAAKVQILLPPPPRALGINVTPPNPNQVHGWVAMVQQNMFILHVGHGNPPPVQVGTVTDVKRNPNTNYGSITIKQSDGTVKTYTVNEFTKFQKVFTTGPQDSNFVGDFTNLTVIVIPRWRDQSVAAGVQVIQDGTNLDWAIYNAQNQPYQTVIYQYTPATSFDFVRDGKSTPANSAALQVGEWVNLEFDPANKYAATAIHVLQPHAIRGKISALTSSAITVTVHVNATVDLPAHDYLVTVGLVKTTQIIGQVGKVQKPLAAMYLQVGQNVIVNPDAVRPHPADQVIVLLPKSVEVTSKGIFAGLMNGSIFVTVKNKNGTTETQSYLVGNNTKYELVKGTTHTPATAANLKPGQTIVIHGVTGPPREALRVEMIVK
jgi:hypothetical protein